MKSLRSYRSKTSQKNKGTSIANDDVTLLAERLEFFIPKLMEVMTLWQILSYLFFLALFMTVMNRHQLETGSDFLIFLASRSLLTVIAVLPALYLIDYLRPVIKYTDPIKVICYVLLLFMMTTGFATFLVMLIMINIGQLEYVFHDFILDLLSYMLFGGGFALIFLQGFLRRYRELNVLKRSFEYKLKAQNDILKARLAPHFFFNTINSLASLIESNPVKAAELLQHISVLFRASFSRSREISFEEEVALCEHYLAIESARLADKLVVTWQLPDNDVMYDMVIAALVLQSILEKMLLNVVEMTTETVYIDIIATWHSHRVIITVTVQLPMRALIITHNLRHHVDFYVQAERLKAHFGNSADINSTVTSKQIRAVISYPLQELSL